MKIAISGKGGVGKTTLAAAMAWLFAHEDKKKVLAIDADPAPNLAIALGVEDYENIVPMVEMKELVKERTGATSEEYGKFFKLNPTVAADTDLCAALDGEAPAVLPVRRPLPGVLDHQVGGVEV